MTMCGKEKHCIRDVLPHDMGLFLGHLICFFVVQFVERGPQLGFSSSIITWVLGSEPFVEAKYAR